MRNIRGLALICKEVSDMAVVNWVKGLLGCSVESIGFRLSRAAFAGEPLRSTESDIRLLAMLGSA